MIAFTFIAMLLALAQPAQIPFTVDASEDASANFPGAPQLESSSFGQWKGRWVFIGGRIAGYHALGGGSADFPRADANREVWVVDTTLKPARTYHVPVAQLPAKLQPIKDEWQSTSQLYYQDGSSLYIAGGYGEDSTGHWVTYPFISKIDLPSLIDGVINGHLPDNCIQFTTSPLVQSAGGDLIKLNDGYFYVVMGHVFSGTYTAFEGQGEHNSAPVSQSYLNEIRRLQLIQEEGGKFSVKLIACYKNEKEFHRRDLNVAKVISPQGIGLAAYGGVFTPDTQLSYDKPVYLFPEAPPSVDSGFTQKMNSYRCAKLLLYDPAGSTMYTTFLGGISRHTWDSAAQRFVENARAGSKSDANYLDGLQWSDQISTIRRLMAAGDAKTDESVQAGSLPAFVGTDALFIPADGVARVDGANEIVDLSSLQGTRTFVGYLYGGIRAFPFRFPYNKTSEPYNSGTVPTKPSDLILKVYVQAKTL